ncbi:MAG: 16S rRNA (guanine(527)-N(7))-methyltransferase RsmG [Elusimicrobiota bacterium]|nr:16S rRNA (guanine(527)-N(7))-methyltransferase RsmG [Elusimicrobiota bacterium]
MQNNIFFEKFYQYVLQNIFHFLDDKMLADFIVYFNALKEWNEKFNLISFKSDSEILYRHFVDCLYSSKIIKDLTNLACKTLKVVDIGSGAGMPGIPVKISLPQIKITLIESIAKKCNFLKNVNESLNFDIEVLNERAETTGQNPKYREKYDFALSRAVSKFSPNLEIAVPLLKIGGYFIVYKTKKSIQCNKDGLLSIQNVLRHLGAKLEKILDYELLNQELKYCILVFKKVKHTPAQFPRKTGIPEKKPLL